MHILVTQVGHCGLLPRSGPPESSRVQTRGLLEVDDGRVYCEFNAGNNVILT